MKDARSTVDIDKNLDQLYGIIHGVCKLLFKKNSVRMRLKIDICFPLLYSIYVYYKKHKIHNTYINVYS